jgi:hypothetical protein
MVLPGVIDALTSSIELFGLTQNEKHFDKDLDTLVNIMKVVSIDKEDESQKNWIELKANYTKLKYLHELINFYNMPITGKFIDTLEVFMTTIDKKTEVYLETIKWYDPDLEVHKKCIKIKQSLELSLGVANPLTKLQLVVDAYKILVPIIEEDRNEIIDNELVDLSFRELFEAPRKRQKI